MTLLLDTHVLLWVLTDDRRLGAAARSLVARDEVAYSAASVWELAIKHSLGKIDPPGPVVEAARAAGLRELSVEIAHTLAVADSPLRHADPFDRLLVAQAQVEGARLLTADGAILDVGLRFVVDARR